MVRGEALDKVGDRETEQYVAQAMFKRVAMGEKSAEVRVEPSFSDIPAMPAEALAQGLQTPAS